MKYNTGILDEKKDAETKKDTKSLPPRIEYSSNQFAPNQDKWEHLDDKNILMHHKISLQEDWILTYKKITINI